MWEDFKDWWEKSGSLVTFVGTAMGVLFAAAMYLSSRVVAVDRLETEVKEIRETTDGLAARANNWQTMGAQLEQIREETSQTAKELKALTRQVYTLNGTVDPPVA